MTDSKVVTKEELVTLLRQQLRSEGIPHSHVGLPRDIDFSSHNGVLKVRISNPVANMQANSVAFEGWIVALRSWLPHLTGRVELDSALPSDYSVGLLGDLRVCHCNRFLYRVANFLRLYPDWFSTEEALGEKVGEFMRWLTQGRCCLNHPLCERKPCSRTRILEREIESWFMSGEARRLLCSRWGLDEAKLFNQLPVGLFRGTIERKTAVFTRGAAAIDLGGISKDGETLHIIELKGGNNINLGVISEILFYTAIIYDTCIAEDNLFEFGTYRNARPTRAMKAIQNGRQKLKHLHSHVLAERFHPLFSSSVEELLKDGLCKLGIEFDRAMYDYQNKKLLS